MAIVDSQVHVWDRDRPQRPWIPGGIAFAHRGDDAFLPDQLLQLMDGAGVDGALLISPTWEGYRNDLVIQAATDHPNRFGAIVRVELDKPDSEALAALYRTPGVYGARAVFARATESFLLDGTAGWLWECAEEHGIPLMVYAPGQTKGIRRVAESHPALRLTVCHLGIPYTAAPTELDAWVSDVLTLADLPNIAVKASVLPRFSATGYPFGDLVGTISRTITAFGADRVFWGTDFTGLALDGRSSASYAQAAALFTEIAQYRSEEERAKVLGGALCAWFGIDFGGKRGAEKAS